MLVSGQSSTKLNTTTFAMLSACFESDIRVECNPQDFDKDSYDEKHDDVVVEEGAELHGREVRHRGRR